MSNQIRIQCVTSTDNGTITHIGGLYLDNRRWRFSIAEAIRQIEIGETVFYVSREHRRTEVEVINGSNGKYLRTKPDSSTGNNLSDLPPCPI